MKVVADPDIALVEEVFEPFGEVHLVPGRAWTPPLVRDADLVLVRAVTRVDARLLAGSAVRFVGSATSGIDHVDVDYLKDQGIVFASAPGSNATSVGEYVLGAILVIAAQRGRDLSRMSAAVVGYGHVGSRVVELLTAAGVGCVMNDPLLKEATGEERFLDLNDILSADIVSLHVPLTRTGRYPTYRLLNGDTLSRMKNDAILINAARGGVVDEAALIGQLEKRPAMSAVVDCWENEPDINRELLDRVVLGTAHIAGYGYEGKLRATDMLYAAACEHFDRTPARRHDHVSSARTAVRFGSDLSDDEVLRGAVLSGYDVREDSSALKRLLEMPSGQRGVYFDDLRRHYRKRHEFSRTEITVAHPRLAARLAAVGFAVQVAQTAIPV